MAIQSTKEMATIAAIAVIALALALLPVVSHLFVQPADAKKPTKTTICHVPNGNATAAKTISVGGKAATKHLANHPADHLGAC